MDFWQRVYPNQKDWLLLPPIPTGNQAPKLTPEQWMKTEGQKWIEAYRNPGNGIDWRKSFKNEGDFLRSMWQNSGRSMGINPPRENQDPQPSPTPTPGQPTPGQPAPGQPAPGQPDPGPDPMQQYREELRRQQEAELRRMQEEQARRVREAEEAKRKAEEAKQARMSDRQGALEQSGMWETVQKIYGKNQADIDNYLDSGVFSQRNALAEWASGRLNPLSEDLNKQYSSAVSSLQQQAAGAGMGDASWLRSVEGALRQQQRGLADAYNQTYNADNLYKILSGTPDAIRDFKYNSPQSISDFGKGFAGFAQLDPTLSKLVPGGIDEQPVSWLGENYQKKNPWADIFGEDNDKYKPAQGFLKGILGV